MDQPTSPPDPASLALVTRHLLDRLNPALPGGAADPAQQVRRQVAEAMMAALNPRDAAEAMLAAIAIAAADAALDDFARATHPGTSSETAVRLRINAFSAGRIYQSAQRQLRPRQPAEARKPAARRAPAQPPGSLAVPEPHEGPTEARSIPKVEFFQPHDRFGKPIPLWRSELMTPAQRKASLAMPRDPDLEAQALADEARLMAEQAALDRAGTGPAHPGAG